MVVAEPRVCRVVPERRIRGACRIRVSARFPEVELRADNVARTIRSLKESGREIDLSRDDRLRTRPVGRRRPSPINFGHELRPCRRGESSALSVRHDLPRLVESDPHTGEEIGGVSDEPDIGAVVRRSRFSASGR